MKIKPATTVIGPLISVMLCCVKCLTRDRMRVDFPTCKRHKFDQQTFGGPTTATTYGGVVSVIGCIMGTCSFLLPLSAAILAPRAALAADEKVKACIHQ